MRPENTLRYHIVLCAADFEHIDHHFISRSSLFKSNTYTDSVGNSVTVFGQDPSTVLDNKWIYQNGNSAGFKTGFGVDSLLAYLHKQHA